ITAQRELTPRRHVVKVHQGIDLDEVRAFAGQGRERRAALGWDDRTIVGIVGWLVGWKGQDVFLRAAARVARSHPDVRFVVVGGPGEASFERRLHDLADEVGLGERVVFTGHQSPAYPWFDAIDIVVHSSWGSPFDLVVLEAMALGKPVVATSVGGTGEVVVLDERTGLLVAPGDEGATAAAIGRFLDEPGLAKRVGDAARAHVEQFSDRAMAERFAAVMDGVLR
ncbi:MAG: glycosyltransferase family 4 protein, partial [Acidimicrobiales bacterium]